METEHIYIGDEFAEDIREPTTVDKQKRIRNRVNGTLTTVSFYEEGFIRIRETRKKKLTKEHTLELRYLSDEAVVSKRLALPILWAALGVGVLALLVSFVLPMTGLAQYTISATAFLATGAVICLLLFVYRTEETHRFCTASGHTAVISLTGSFGCVGKVRSTSREISQAIRSADGGFDTEDVRYLRAEMQVHYKLAETGVISREACSDGTSLILSKFG
jgi:hypothetical protein